MNLRNVIGIGACALVLVGLGLGFSEIGSPSLNRSRATDARVQQAIYDIASRTTLAAGSDLNRTAPVYPASLEEDVRRQIAFQNRSTEVYVLCADFETAGNEFAQYGTEGPTWAHPAGHYCYRFHWKHERSDAYAPLPL